MKGKILVTISKLGQPKIEGSGFIGKECDAKMRPVENAFNGVVARTNKPEYDEVSLPIQQQEQIPQ